jgi:hypothetical protein
MFITAGWHGGGNPGQSNLLHCSRAIPNRQLGTLTAS